MQQRNDANRWAIPPTLQAQLQQFRTYVWRTKLLEACGLLCTVILLGYALLFASDRLQDTTPAIRWLLWGAALVSLIWIPWVVYRWVWRQRTFPQLARLLRRRDRRIGDPLLGVIELAEDRQEQQRSPALVAAALRQVAESAQGRDFTNSAPRHHARQWLGAAGALAALAIGLLALFPEAAANAWQRIAFPWKKIPRYTFAQLQPLPDPLVVAHGEPSRLDVALSESTRWKPAEATARLPFHPDRRWPLQSNRYSMELPALTADTSLEVRVGDQSKSLQVIPKLRPVLEQIEASIQLPEYLQIAEPIQRDARSGSVQAVTGSSVQVRATASRSLTSATIDGRALPVEDRQFLSPPRTVEGESMPPWVLTWKDADQLEGSQPFELKLLPKADDAPTISVEGLPRQAVVLVTEQINFQFLAGDDFGVRRAGMEWKGVPSELVGQPAAGEQVLAAGGPQQTAMQWQGVFNANDWKIEPQAIELRVWVEDYLPERGRIYSPPHTFFVLSADQHAIWITEQLSKWHRQSLDVRDREMQLHETNKQLRALEGKQLDQPDARQMLETQATAEAANGRRLAQLTKVGEELVRQAARNSEIQADQLDRWAEMLQVLEEISGDRMPGVEELLKQAAKSKSSIAQNASPPPGPQAGQQRDPSGGSQPSPESMQPPDPESAKMPSIGDQESSQRAPDDPKDGKEGKPKPPKDSPPSRLSLPSTTIASSDAGEEQEDQEPSEAQPKVQQAVEKQRELLTEFEKISDELNQVLANLEGSTLVKRLKAASREQLQVANRLNDRIQAFFAQSSHLEEADRRLLASLTDVEGRSSQSISNIMDDLQAYFDRRRMNQFKLVLDEMRSSDILAALRTLGDEIPKEQGMSIAQCEFWADTLDRWADDLVDPTAKGESTDSEGKSKDSLPPGIILEALQILEAEVNLREETRVAEQSKAAIEEEEHQRLGQQLGDKQQGLQTRIADLVKRIQRLPEAQENFQDELDLLGQVETVMGDASGVLALPNTGPEAIAMETEAIELLLKSKRINPKSGGGGGGTAPGGGGKGDTKDSALALIGTGINPREFRESREIQQATGEQANPLPEEFRAGLDEYFNRLDRDRP